MTKSNTKQEEKKVEQQQDTTMRIPLDLKALLEEMKGPQESVADVVRRLMISRAVKESEEGMVVLKMPEINYRQLLAFQPTNHLSEILQKARV